MRSWGNRLTGEDSFDYQGGAVGVVRGRDLSSDESAPSDPTGAERIDLYRKWGVVPGPWLWSTPIRILIVVDGRIDSSKGSGCFGLGYVLETLINNMFAWWVRFEVRYVRRDSGSWTLCGDDFPWYHPEDFNFRFTKPGFDLNMFHQVWFFGDYPANEAGDPYDPMYSPLGDDELKLLAEWMDRGGGVFATGDHANLGASLCSRIPRVRTMRKWTAAQDVPPQYGSSRHETTQGAPGVTTTYDNEEDTVPQPIEPGYRATATSIAVRNLVPHPLLCTRDGVITEFPDHMHEGEVIEDGAVELGKPLGIPGYAGAEYPPALDAQRPRPHPSVVAYGRTTSSVQHEFGSVNAKRFPLIGAYDGDPAGIGRVVVDSTWHHWFSTNLIGLHDGNPAAYARMQAYYRNVALWLATPAQRASMLFASAWGAVASDPMAFPPALAGSIWQVGERAVDVIGRTASQCTLYDLVVGWLDVKAVEALSVPTDLPPSEPNPSSLPTELVLRAIVGGVASSFLEPALEYRRTREGERPLLDPELIVRRGTQGIELGRRALAEAVRDSVEAGGKLAQALTGAPTVSPQSIPIPVQLQRLRVAALRLQLPDSSDPVLADGRFTFTIGVRVGRTWVANQVFEETVPSFDEHGAFVDLDRVLYEGLTQSGEDIFIEVAAGSERPGTIPPERLRFSDHLGSDSFTWIGVHEPSSTQSWRLWYAVEPSEAAPESNGS
jgi:hypothetical protein